MFKNLVVYCIFLLSSAALYVAKPFGGRIFGGQVAEPGQFPYIVAVEAIVEGARYHHCGGSILNSQWIVTAGHCIETYEVEQYVLIVGTNLLNAGGVTYSATKTVLHPDYNLDVIENDIGLIKIDGEFDFTDAVASIDIGESTGNESSTILGWGATELGSLPNELIYVGVTALSNDDCIKLAEGSTYINDYPPGPYNICAFGSQGNGACYGDSGGPLVYNNTLIGITSYLLGASCGSGYPDVYTRAGYFKDWIENTISAN